MTAAREHIERIRSMSCGVCGASPPSIAHHIREGQGMSQRASDWLVIPTCWACHQGPDGWHGTRALWRIRKLGELDVLANTIRRLYG